jgi:hypothetical protein
MNANDFVKYLPATKTSLAQTNVSELKFDRIKIQENNEIDPIFFHGLLLGYLVTSLFVLLTFLKRIKANKDRIGYEKNVTNILQIPCKKCRFYAHNPHLKCAAHPAMVMTEGAIDCPDYCPNSK